MVVLGIPLKFITDPETKFEPVAVRVKLAPPAASELGVMLVSTGAGLLPVTVKATALEVPPPADGLTTITLKVPAVAKLDAGTEAVNWLDETNVVARTVPLKLTWALLSKLLPFTVSVLAALPTGADVIDKLLMLGVAAKADNGIMASSNKPEAATAAIVFIFFVFMVLNKI